MILKKMRNLYNQFIEMDKKLLGVIIIFNMILGLVLSSINDKYEHFFLLQSLVTTVLVIEIIVLKLYKKRIIDLYCYIEPNSITGCNYAQMRKDNCSLKVRLMAGGFGFISNIFFLALHLIPINSLGVYICILLYVTLYFSMIGYIQVILFMKFLKQFNVNDINLINKIFRQYGCELLKQLCFCYRKKGDISAAIESIDEAIRLALKNSLRYGNNDEARENLAICYMNKGVIYDEQGVYDETIENYNMGVNIFRELIAHNDGKVNLLINALLNLGTVCYNDKDYNKAEHIFMELLNALGGVKEEDSRGIYAMEYLKKIQGIKGERT